MGDRLVLRPSSSCSCRGIPFYDAPGIGASLYPYVLLCSIKGWDVSIHRIADRDCLKRGCWVVIKYSSMHENALPNRPLRFRMGLLGATSSHPPSHRSPKDP